ncbi:MAG: rhomboid family intramembrane serine protease [Bacteroidales bacterium]|nr:rhomboid family intramembrane serine protease [Bacteroidales bacterium]
MTFILIAFTAIISIVSFSNSELFSKLQFNPYQVYHKKEFYRLITHGFVHADWMHLIVNMFVLFFFGRSAEYYLKSLQAGGIIKFYPLIFVLFYLVSIVISSMVSLYKHKDNIWYNSVGASGAVSAVMFFSIFFNPWEKLYLYAMLPIPGIIFGIAYLVYSQYMSKRGGDNVNHDAHFVGAVFGFLFPLILDVKLINHFISSLFG